MGIENPLWGAPRIHGELLKLGFEIAQSSVAKYMVKRRGPPNQSWRTFLHNHAPDIAAMDLFIAPTIGFALCLRHRSARPQRLERADASTDAWLADGGLERREIPHQMNAHKHN
jgi:hypothetical protein